MRLRAAAVALALVCAPLISCSGDAAPPDRKAPGVTLTNPADKGDPTLIGAGDIAGCGGSEGSGRTSAIIAKHPEATVFTLGDNAYTSGQPQQYAKCYAPTWGVHKARTRPITGDHDTETVPGGTPPNAGFTRYFRKQLAPFGPTATDRLKSYYSYDVGAWHVVALNSPCYEALPGCDAPLQERWFRDDLVAHPNACTLVMWHNARWSSGAVHGGQLFTQPLWDIAYSNGVDVVLSGNEHDYERFAPQDAQGKLDTKHGVRAFVVGTGGYYLYHLGHRQPNSEVYSSTYGVIELTLHAASYDWQFIPVAGQTFTDSGTDSCRDAPPQPAGTPTVRSSASTSAPYRSTSLTINKPGGAEAGDVLVAMLSYQGGSSPEIKLPRGWTEVPDTHVSEGTNAGMQAFYRVATGSEPASYKFKLAGGSGQSIAGGIMAIKDADTDAPINASASLVQGPPNATTLTAPSVTTTRPNTLLLYGGATNTALTFTPPQLMPEQWDVSAGGDYKVSTEGAAGGVAAAGPTGTRKATLSSASRGVAMTIAIAGPPD